MAVDLTVIKEEDILHIYLVHVIETVTPPAIYPDKTEYVDPVYEFNKQQVQKIVRILHCGEYSIPNPINVGDVSYSDDYLIASIEGKSLITESDWVYLEIKGGELICFHRSGLFAYGSQFTVPMEYSKKYEAIIEEVRKGGHRVKKDMRIFQQYRVPQYEDCVTKTRDD